VTYLSKRFGDAGNANEVPGHVVADATVAFRLIKNFDLRLNVLNLADATCFTQVYQAHVVPGAGRTFLVTATLAF
jgi:catecholate siderophore receptor